MFKGMSQCMPTVGILCFGLFNPFHYSPLPLYFPPPIFQQLSEHTLISFTFPSCVLQYYWCSIILFFLSSFPEFHSVDSLLQTCSTSEFVYDCACFCVYMFIFWTYLPHMRENMQPSKFFIRKLAFYYWTLRWLSITVDPHHYIILLNC
jgi:hypothetical protein